MEEQPACPFQRLPADLCHSFLIQAFQQLDQRDLYGVIARVCQQWHQLSLDCCSSLDIELKTVRGVRSLISWLKHHCSLLVSLQITTCEGAAAFKCVDSFLQSLAAAPQLRSLAISTSELEMYPMDLRTPIPNLPALTSLTLTRVSVPLSNQEALMQLPQLRSLSLIQCQSYMRVGFFQDGRDIPEPQPFGSKLISGIASSLKQLTSLDLSGSCLDPGEDVSPLTALNKLVELRLRVEVGTTVRLPPSLPVTAVAFQLSLLPLQNMSLLRGCLRPLLAGKLDTVVLSYEWDRLGKLVMPELFAALGSSGQQLRSLTLEGISAHRGGGVGQLAALTQLTKLQLACCDVHNNEVQQLSALTGLRCLSLAGNDLVTGHGGAFEALATSLRQLSTLMCHIQADAAVRGAFGDRIAASWARPANGNNKEYRLDQA